MWPGIHDTACEHDVNVICFPAGQLRTPHQFEQRDVIYDLISAEKLDGLILRAGTIFHHMLLITCTLSEMRGLLLNLLLVSV